MWTEVEKNEVIDILLKAQELSKSTPSRQTEVEKMIYEANEFRLKKYDELNQKRIEEQQKREEEQYQEVVRKSANFTLCSSCKFGGSCSRKSCSFSRKYN